MERMYLSKITGLLILLVAVVAFLFGAYLRPFALIDSNQTSSAKSLSSTTGRFTLAISPLVKTEKFLLDTQSGKIWQLVKSGDLPDKPFVCHRLAVLTDDPDHSDNANNKSKLSLKITNNKFANDKTAKGKALNEKALAEKIPTDKVTVEIIKSGTLFKEQVPISRNSLSAKAPTQTNL